MGLVLTPEQYHVVETWSPGAGKLLKEWRESHHMTQTKLASKVLCDDTTIRNWEAERKRPIGQRKELLLAVLAPKNIVRVTTEGYVTSHDLETLLSQLQSEYREPIEKRYYLLDGNYDKVLICLIMKCTGTIMPGVDISAVKIFFDQYDKTREQFELSQGKKLERVSSRGRKWLESSLDNKPVDSVSTVPVTADDELQSTT